MTVNLVGLTDPLGNATTFARDLLGRVVGETDPLGQERTYQYDAAGRLTVATDRSGRRREFAYDALGRRTAETWLAAGGGVADTLTFSYDANGNLLSAANQWGTYTRTYDALDRLATQQDLWGLGLTFGYHAAGQRDAVTDSQGGCGPRSTTRPGG